MEGNYVNGDCAVCTDRCYDSPSSAFDLVKRRSYFDGIDCFRKFLYFDRSQVSSLTANDTAFCKNLPVVHDTAFRLCVNLKSSPL